ncbi:guanine nucleotide exchange factor DSS4 PWA37_002600 [Arxiozyma heterogenica]|uniref:Protein DSS4 n=1 Tax=Arxiozyma heterogenica TaxID=278026 RepID=A0AAN7WME5_9SACH|nr:hypothetical protein RI543_002187 [Kazachstania heterogenica]
MSYCCAFSDCRCRILKIDSAPIVKVPSMVLDKFHLMQKSKDQDLEEYTDFILINDVWDFDNIGVSKEILANSEILDRVEFEHDNRKWQIEKHLKYLVCANCDKGPIGVVCSTKSDNQTKIIYLLSIPSVSQI